MDLAENMSPAMLAILVTLGLAGIGLVVWLVRLEAKGNANASNHAELKLQHGRDLAEVKKEHAGDIKRVEDELRDTRERFFKHVADVSLHHNAEAVLEFRTALERRFTGMEKSLEDITRKLNHIAGRE